MHSGHCAAVLGPYHNKHHISADNASTTDTTGAIAGADDGNAVSDASSENDSTSANAGADDNTFTPNATSTTAKFLQIPR